METVESFNDQSSTVRSQKSRITSLSTILGENPKVHSDKLGIRKFAKACSKPFSSWGNQSDDNQSSLNLDKAVSQLPDDKISQGQAFNETKSINNDESLQDISTKMESFSLRNMTRRYMKKSQPNVALSEAEVSNWKSNFDEAANEEPQAQIQMQNTHSEQHHLQQVPNFSHDSQELLPQPQPLGERRSYLQTNSNIANIINPAEKNLDITSIVNGIEQVEIKFENFSNSDLEFGRRVVRFKNFPFNVSIKAVVAQLCGGPLEKVEVVTKANISYSPSFESGKMPLRNCFLDVWFLNSDDARKFMEFTRTGLFLVNGNNFQPEWAPTHIQNQQRIDYSDINSIRYTYPFHEATPTDISEEMIINQARRCIIMKKYISKKGNKSVKSHYPDALDNFSRINFEAMKKDFLQFGAVLEFYPVVSKKLCFIVHFFEVQSAIEAKRCFDDELSDFHEKWRGWTIWYGTDPSEKPCIET
ncbi:hypothetical protein WICPIJ_004633 [Wickerhamomyces pijperi]|uniref:Uncharacterized protein n=1 Tax=Wickerhamomyces pijperi TaxID=599730 RepID=A0A9P8TLV3_WICPI|nr:hypothetical protein WICPIJ_004633 [Wickerhamomyces pijperi]